jgi:hypothetical protein
MIPPSKSSAVLSLAPGAQFVLVDGVISRWDSPDIPQPTAQEIDAEFQRLTAEYPTKVAARAAAVAAARATIAAGAPPNTLQGLRDRVAAIETLLGLRG